MGLLRGQFSYSRVNKEDPEDKQHLKARFLIHKMLEEAEMQQMRRSASRLRLCRVKRKIGLRLKRLSIAISKARLSFCRQVRKQFRHLRLVLITN